MKQGGIAFALVDKMLIKLVRGYAPTFSSLPPFLRRRPWPCLCQHLVHPGAEAIMQLQATQRRS
jgi:hypothetical protein